MRESKKMAKNSNFSTHKPHSMGMTRGRKWQKNTKYFMSLVASEEENKNKKINYF